MHPALRDDLAAILYVTSSDATGLRSFCVRAIRTKANPRYSNDGLKNGARVFRAAVL